MPDDRSIETRFTRLTVLPEGEPLYSEMATHVEIKDDAAGEFVTVTQFGGSVEHEEQLRIRPEEWPAVAEAVEMLLDDCLDPS